MDAMAEILQAPQKFLQALRNFLQALQIGRSRPDVFRECECYSTMRTPPLSALLTIEA